MLNTFPSPLVASRPRKLILTTLVTLCALVGGLVFVSAPAFAEATHVFSKYFGEPCSVTPCGPGQLANPEGVAINEHTGQVYVVDTGDSRVEYFSGEGAYEGQFNGSGEYETTVAGKLKKETGAAAPTGKFSTPENIAVDNDPSSESYGDVYVTDTGHGVVDKFSASGGYIDQLVEGEPGELFGVAGQYTGVGGVAVGSDGVLWVALDSSASELVRFNNARDNEYQSRTANLGSLLEFEESHSALAIDSLGEDLYATTDIWPASPPITVSKLDSSGESLIQSIGDIVGGQVGGAGGIAVESSNGSVYITNNYTKTIYWFGRSGSLIEEFGAEQLVSANGVAVSSGTHDVYVADAGTDRIDVYTVPITKPSLQGEAFSKVTEHSATLSAQVSQHGLETTYMIEYGTTEAYGLIAKEATLPASIESSAISTTLEGVLQPETTYHFRVVATNADGTSRGADLTFTTQSDLLGLPDGRGYEMVSPVANADGNVYWPSQEGLLSGLETSDLSMRASADGEAVEYVADPPAVGGDGHVGGGEGNEYVARRAPDGGWSAADLDTRGLNRLPWEASLPNELTNAGTSTVPAGTFVLSVKGEPQPDQEDYYALEWEEQYAYGYKPGVGGQLLASIGGRSTEVSILPSGLPVTDATFGDVEGAELVLSELSHVISADGARIFWTDTETGADYDHIFVRENGEKTVPVSAGAAVYWTASANGEYVYYTETGVLYRFDVSTQEHLAITPADADVLGVTGTNQTGEPGEYVYFVAVGSLTAANPEGHLPAAESPNLYVQHHGITTFIATLSGADNDVAIDNHISTSRGDWLAGMGERTAEVAADGSSVTFDSYASLTGYESSGADEVYVYDANTERLSCASCNPSGTPATGFATLAVSLHSRFTLRSISETGGRVFFDSSEALVSQDTNGTQDVYEWEREGEGSCAQVSPKRRSGGCIYLLSGGTSPDKSFFLDASASGNDVFIITRAELTPQDQGETFELYDARVGAVQPLTEPACTGTGCQGLPSAPPPFATPSSVTFNGVGNFPPPSLIGVKPKPKTKTIKCAKGKKRNKHNQCVEVKTKKKTIKAKKSASNDRRAN